MIEDELRHLAERVGKLEARISEHERTLRAELQRVREEERQACRGEALKELGKPVHPLTASRIADRIRARGEEGRG